MSATARTITPGIRTLGILTPGIPTQAPTPTPRELERLRARHQSAIDAKLDVPLTFAGAYPSLRIKRAITYSKGALFLVRLREVMGERAFWRALARYTRRFAGGVATTGSFQGVFAAETDRDLASLFEAWAYGPAPAAPAR